MVEVLIIVFFNFILMSSVLYLWDKLLDRNIDYKNYRLYLTLVGMMLTSITNFFVVNKFIRIALITIILMLFFKYLYRESLNKTIITPIFTQVIIFIAEFLCALIFLLIFGNESNATIDFLGNFAINLVIAGTLFALSQLSFTKKVYNKLLKATDRINSIQLCLFCVVAMIILNLSLYETYKEVQIQYILIFNVGVTLLVLIIMYYSFKTQNKYNKVSNKYNIAIKSLNDYENMMAKYRIASHENKNLLLTIRAMIVNKDKDIPKYIDSIIEERYIDDEKLLFNVSSIPSGGLRSTIYSEILKIKENKIDYILNIDREIRTVDLIELDTNTVIDICKIIGVFIDNSIEAVVNLKRRNINIELYVQNNNLCIKVSNNYSGNINMAKINDDGYTTKGKNHGYGLSLVKNIVKNNSTFKHETEISKNIFSQILIIKIKN